ncbi:MAG: Alcohol dehydrogenase [acceptor] [Alphaproteobacteria bacterium MarineAlpha11_Bin1]|nr:MAG: Alcohol dehydrogenase [acceptor] [Alphaproteobacteria bacterium MarineAlpha11_Bin1]|tara:strand:+ start:3614 stop:5236 length:1623 start_codon:yes stop_codon:yes gene_type:complete
MPESGIKKFDKFDYVIVGAGTAGCVIANRLSADPEVNVLLLEAGGRDNYFWIKIPVGYLYTINNPRTDWCYQTEQEPGLNGRALAYPRGKTLGGCSAINGMIYMRGHERDYDQWRQMGNTGWGWEDVLPLFQKSENFAGGESDLHGVDGEWRVEHQRLSWEVLDAFREACVEVGIPKTEDFNLGTNDGVGYFHVNQRRGVRWSAAHAFLHPIKHRKNLTVLTKAHAKNLTITDGRVTGVDFWLDNADAHAAAAREVVLASGAVGSPQILQLSGIGQGRVLRDRGVDVVHHLPGVGENLQDHLQIRAVYKVQNAKTLNECASSLIGKAIMGLEYALFKRGPMTMAPSQLGVFTKSDPRLEMPNLQYHVQPLSLEKFGEPLHRFPAITASVCNLRPDSRGHIRITSPDPRAKPSIRPNYLSAKSDQEIAANALKLTRKIVAASAMEKYQPEEYLPGPQVETDEDLSRAAGDIATTIFHPVGTCKMGSDSMAVVDERLRLRGLAGLRIADASIMPTITSGNTNSPTIMIAEKAAEMIKLDHAG